MLKELLDALKVKFPDISEHILNRIAKSKANTVTTAEQVKTFVDGLTLQQVIDSYADSRATEATDTAVHNYETKYGLRNGVKVENPTAQPAAPVITNPTQTTQQQGGAAQSTTDALLAQLLEQNKQLNERLNKFEGERTTATRRQQVADITAKLPESLRKPYERISLDSLTDEQFETLKGELQTEIDGIASGIQSKGAVFGRPNAPQGGAVNQNELTKEQEAAIASRSSVITEKGQQPF